MQEQSPSSMFYKVFLKIKKRLWHRCFPVYFTKVLNIFFIENLQVTILQEYTCSIGKYLCKVNIIS